LFAQSLTNKKYHPDVKRNKNTVAHKILPGNKSNEPWQRCKPYAAQIDRRVAANADKFSGTPRMENDASISLIIINPCK
jgi:hypothetical protein